jgi:hypothetical protein
MSYPAHSRDGSGRVGSYGGAGRGAVGWEVDGPDLERTQARIWVRRPCACSGTTEEGSFRSRQGDVTAGM